VSVIERVKAHAEGLGRKQVEVPEWQDDDGNPTVIYCKPIVMYEMRKWWSGINKDDMSVFVDIIIAKAEDAEGQKMFTLEDKQPLLRKAEYSVLARVAGEMIDHTDADTLEKN
tara:strand:- start:1112 stop:1450 length:339 start_codon:yes stop_codon:yes gene_type:complete